MGVHKNVNSRRRRRRRSVCVTPLTAVDQKRVHSCYILYSPATKKVYVGYTTNPARRLRQHRGEIQGGAKRTQKMKDDKMRFLAIISRFINARDAQFFEWLLERAGNCHTRRRCTSPRKICEAVHTLLNPELLAPKKSWTKTALPLVHPLRNLPFTVKWSNDLPRGFQVPSNTAYVSHTLDA